jgi:hypothetical protein
VANARVKITYGGTSREINLTSGHNLDPLLDAVVLAIKKELDTKRPVMASKNERLVAEAIYRRRERS